MRTQPVVIKVLELSGEVVTLVGDLQGSIGAVRRKRKDKSTDVHISEFRIKSNGADDGDG